MDRRRRALPTQLSSRLLIGLIALFFVTTILGEKSANAWILEEHRRITRRALEKIEASAPAAARAVLLESSETFHLCRSPYSGSLTSPYCGATDLSLEVLPAIAADHTCTPSDLEALLDAASVKQGRASNPKDARGTWIRDVLQVADEASEKLRKLDVEENGGTPEARAEIRRRLNIELQLKDADYANRTELDWSHFQLTRERGQYDLEAYLAFVFAPGSRSNAAAAFANYHLVALNLAAQRNTSGDQRVKLLRRILTAEAFALHFLEDAFATGHFVGHWGGQGPRLGSHDRWSEGIEALRWTSLDKNAPHEEPYVAHGDAFLSDFELELVSNAVAESLTQVLLAATATATADTGAESAHGYENYDSCLDANVAPGLGDLAHGNGADADLIKKILRQEPIPAPRNPEIPRYRAEVGVFFGAAATGDLGIPTMIPINGGDRGASSRFRATARIGFGAGGLTHDPLNSQAFFEFGFTGLYVDATSSNGFTANGWTMRLRAPGLVTALEGLFIIPAADATRNTQLLQAGAKASSGGCLQLWKSHRLFEAVYWQFSFLRDVTFNRYPKQASLGRDSFRHELIPSLFAARTSVPISGSSWAQSTDLYFDIAPTVTWSSLHPSASFGGIISMSAASRVFP